MVDTVERLNLAPGFLDISSGRPLNELAMAIYDYCESHGWNKDFNFQEKLLLIHSEISEAFEHYRNGAQYQDLIWDKDGKPDGIGIELIDVMIRLLHLCAYIGFDIDKLMAIKMEYNETRPYRHGNKQA